MDAQYENTTPEAVSLADATRTAVNHIRQTCDDNNIKIETDIDGVDLQVSPALIIPAVAYLLTNAIAAMPQGGELSITLVETPSQWELEVADSGHSPSRFQTALAIEDRQTTPGVQDNQDGKGDQDAACHDPEEPTILRFESHRTLLVVDQLAQAHNGTVQTYRCPLGGTAHVLIVPKFADALQQDQSKRAG